MYGHRSFLVLGGGAADIVSLVKGGLEILSYDFVFQQGIDQRGKATTRVYGGSIDVTLAQLPPNNIIEWGLKSRSYEKGSIIMLDGNNMPVEKIFFENAACINFEVKYAQKGDGYAATKLSIQAESIIVGNGIDFLNEWNT